MTMRTYSELIKIQDYRQRYEYLKCNQRIGELTFGYERYLNQALYNSKEWRQLKPHIIARDNGCDMAHPDYEIAGRIIIHHIEPITIEMIVEGDPRVYDPDNLVCVSHLTHEAIHYSNENLLPKEYVERRKGDTKLW